MVNEEQYSEELKSVFSFLENVILEEHPTTTVTVPYLILAILSERNCMAFSVIERMVTSASIESLIVSLLSEIKSNELISMRPNKKYQMGKDVSDLLDSAVREKEQVAHLTHGKEDKLNTIHIMLALLSGKDDFIKRGFTNVGIDYTQFLSKAYDNQERGRAVFDEMVKDAFGLPPGAKIEMIQMGEMNPFGPPAGMPSKKNSTESFCTDLTEKAAKGKLDKLVGRELEIEKIFRVLGRRKKNNVLLLGDGGVGKTAIINGIAQRIVDGNVPKPLKNKKIYALDMTAIIAGTQFRGMLESRFKMLFEELKKNKDIILFIDDIHQIVSEGKNDMDISEMVNKSMSDGDIQVIGCTTYKLYKKNIESNSSLDRKFQKINVDAETIENSINILNDVKEYYENYHNVKYTDKSITDCVILANKYIPERLLPDSAIDIIDEVGAYAAMNRKGSDDVERIEAELKRLQEERGKMIRKDNPGAALSLDNEINQLTVQLIDARNKEAENEKPIEITEDDVYKIVSEKTGIPISRLSIDEKKSLARIDESIKKVVIGQDEAVDLVCQAIKRNRIGLSSKNKPVSTLFIGNSGVGKTLIAKAIAKEVFGKEKYLVRFDMSEYADKTSVSKLIGTGAGYVGYDSGGLLTEAIKRNKYCVLLCDEIEKADPDIYNVFLQIMDEGRITDNTGNVVDCKNLILIFTSNVGTRAAMENGEMIGFTNPGTDVHKKNILRKELKNKFAPEFINRIDEIVYFNTLTDDNLREIIKLELNKTREKIENIGYQFNYDDTTVEYIFEKISKEKEYGARPIIRTIQDEIENKITDIILEDDNKKEFVVRCVNSELLF